MRDRTQKTKFKKSIALFVAMSFTISSVAQAAPYSISSADYLRPSSAVNARIVHKIEAEIELPASQPNAAEDGASTSESVLNLILTGETEIQADDGEKFTFKLDKLGDENPTGYIVVIYSQQGKVVGYADVHTIDRGKAKANMDVALSDKYYDLMYPDEPIKRERIQREAEEEREQWIKEVEEEEGDVLTAMDRLMTKPRRDYFYNALQIHDDVRAQYKGLGSAAMTVILSILKRDGIEELLIGEKGQRSGGSQYPVKAPGFFLKTGFVLKDKGTYSFLMSKKNIPPIFIKRKGINTMDMAVKIEDIPKDVDNPGSDIKSSSAGDTDQEAQRIMAGIRAVNEAVYRGDFARNILPSSEFGPDAGRDNMTLVAVKNYLRKPNEPEITLPGVGIPKLEVIEENGRIVGYMIYGTAPADIESITGGSAYIFFMAVHPDARGKRLGEELFKKVAAFVREHGKYKLALNVNKDNPYKAFYDRMGGLPEVDGKPIILNHTFHTPKGIASTDLYIYRLRQNVSGIKSSSAGESDEIARLINNLREDKDVRESAASDLGDIGPEADNALFGPSVIDIGAGPLFEELKGCLMQGREEDFTKATMALGKMTRSYFKVNFSNFFNRYNRVSWLKAISEFMPDKSFRSLEFAQKGRVIIEYERGWRYGPDEALNRHFNPVPSLIDLPQPVVYFLINLGSDASKFAFACWGDGRLYEWRHADYTNGGYIEIGVERYDEAGTEKYWREKHVLFPLGSLRCTYHAEKKYVSIKPPPI